MIMNILGIYSVLVIISIITIGILDRSRDRKEKLVPIIIMVPIIYYLVLNIVGGF